MTVVCTMVWMIMVIMTMMAMLFMMILSSFHPFLSQARLLVCCVVFVHMVFTGDMVDDT